MELGSHVSPWRQTGKQTLRLASARRAPQQQYKQCVGIAFLHAGLLLLLLFLTFSALVANPKKTTLHGGQSRSWSAEQRKKEKEKVWQRRTRPKHQLDQFRREGEHPALPCRDDVVAECGAAASESCLPSSEMRPSTAAGGLVFTGEASKATETNYNQPSLRLYSTEERDHLEANCKKNSISFASNDSSSVFQERNLSAALFCRRVVDTKSRQNRTFIPGGSQNHLRACPFSGQWRALVCGEILRAEAAGDELQRFFLIDSLTL